MAHVPTDSRSYTTAHWAHAVHDDVTNFEPSFQREHFEESEHGTADVVEIEIMWIGPGRKSSSTFHRARRQPTKRVEPTSLDRLRSRSFSTRTVLARKFHGTVSNQ